MINTTSKFAKLRQSDKVYVDKTEWIAKLLNKTGFYYLSQTKGFGKSMLLSTIKEVLNCNKQIFTDLWIDGNMDWTFQNQYISMKFEKGKDPEQILKLALSKTDFYFSNPEESSALDMFESYLQCAIQPIILIDDFEFAYTIDNLFPQKLISLLKKYKNQTKLCFMTMNMHYIPTDPHDILINFSNIFYTHGFSNLTGFTKQEILTNFGQKLRELSKGIDKQGDAVISYIAMISNKFIIANDKVVYNSKFVNDFLYE